MTHVLKKAYFAGSFNPFTLGHADIVERALTMFDEIVIGIGYNMKKPEAEKDTAKRMTRIAEIYKDNPKIRVESYCGLTAEAARKSGAEVLLRGVRDTNDFEYERQIADVNRNVFGIDTVLLFASPEYASLSSSMVRELDMYGIDTSRFLP